MFSPAKLMCLGAVVDFRESMQMEKGRARTQPSINSPIFKPHRDSNEKILMRTHAEDPDHGPPHIISGMALGVAEVNC